MKSSNALMVLAGAVLFMASRGAQAGIILTAAGTSEGFTLSTFADQFPNNVVGPVGIAVTSTGAVMVSSDASGRNVVFPDVDNQHFAAGAVSSTYYGFNNATGLTNNGTAIFQAQQTTGSVIQVDNSGNFVRTVVTGVPLATGIATNPNNGHLFVSTLNSGVIWDVNPVTNTKTAFVNASADGLTANSTNLYAAVNGHILGYHISNGVQFFDSGFINGVDGAALGTGSLAGKLYANTNFGQIVEVDLATATQTLIATGGSRGDLVSVDSNNGSLLLTQTDSVVRLTAPTGCGFGTTPEPTSLTLACLGIAGVLGHRWRNRKSRP
jgi:hypothetical protein